MLTVPSWSAENATIDYENSFGRTRRPATRCRRLGSGGSEPARRRKADEPAAVDRIRRVQPASVRAGTAHLRSGMVSASALSCGWFRCRYRSRPGAAGSAAFGAQSRFVEQHIQAALGAQPAGLVCSTWSIFSRDAATCCPMTECRLPDRSRRHTDIGPKFQLTGKLVPDCWLVTCQDHATDEASPSLQERCSKCSAAGFTSVARELILVRRPILRGGRPPFITQADRPPGSEHLGTGRSTPGTDRHRSVGRRPRGRGRPG